jgi:hypothetical protein
MTPFDVPHEVVIRGAISRYEEVHPSISRAQFIADALERALNEKWSIIVYDTFDDEAGYYTYFQYQDKWWVHGKRKINRRGCDKAAIRRFMNVEFGCFVLGGCSQVQSSAQTKINQRFPGTWKVQVVKFLPKSLHSAWIKGIYWRYGSYNFYIMKIS